MVLGKGRFQSDEAVSMGRVRNGFSGGLIGSISTLVGIGGATLSVPYMSLHGVSMHRAIGTASALGLVIAAPAALGFIAIGWGLAHLPPFSIGYVNFLAWACIIPVSVVVAPIGARLTHKVDAVILRRGFAVLILLVALNMWRKILMGG